MVVSSAGGRAVTEWSGYYRLEVAVPRAAQDLQITAVSGAGHAVVASRTVAVDARSGSVPVDPLELALGSCSPSWLPTFGGAPGTSQDVLSFVVFDDGGGPALYVGGFFEAAGGVVARSIAKWDGTSWTPLGSGLSGIVYDLAVFDDGGGPALHACGTFVSAGGVTVNRIAKWNGSAWSALGTGLTTPASSPAAFAMAVFDDGAGPDLYVGGTFTRAGGLTTNRIARWTGSAWQSFGSGVSGGSSPQVRALTVFDDGSGAALYVGGLFTTAGASTTVNHIAKWNGSSWSALGTGMGSTVSALTVHDDGSGSALFAGGAFLTSGGVTTNCVAKWDGAAWAALGTGISSTPPGTRVVWTLTEYDDGSGVALYAGGGFTDAGGASASRIAKWDGSSWSALTSGVDDAPNDPPSVDALMPFDAGGGSKLYVGGSFNEAGGMGANHIATWDGAWGTLQDGVSKPVCALAVSENGGNAVLYACGHFTGAGGLAANHVAQWDGSSWSLLGSGMDSVVRALAVFDDSGGSALYAGGQFTAADGVSANRMARWDGSGWTALGSGMNSSVLALLVWDDGGGAALYAGGAFTTAGGGTANFVAKWNGSSWSAIGAGVSSTVYAMAVYDDGSGPALFTGGSSVRKWNGSTWTSIGAPGGGSIPRVFSLAVFDDGSGPALYAGGSFTSMSGVTASRIAKWNGAVWTTLGSGVSGVTNDTSVDSLAVYLDGAGTALYAGGEFDTAGGVAASCIARWNGTSWSAVGSGVGVTAPETGSIRAESVDCLVVYDDGTGPGLHAGGNFASAFDSGDSYLARWQECDSVPPTLFCPTSVTVVDSLQRSPRRDGDVLRHGDRRFRSRARHRVHAPVGQLLPHRHDHGDLHGHGRFGESIHMRVPGHGAAQARPAQAVARLGHRATQPLRGVPHASVGTRPLRSCSSSLATRGFRRAHCMRAASAEERPSSAAIVAQSTPSISLASRRVRSSGSRNCSARRTHAASSERAAAVLGCWDVGREAPKPESERHESRRDSTWPALRAERRSSSTSSLRAMRRRSPRSCAAFSGTNLGPCVRKFAIACCARSIESRGVRVRPASAWLIWRCSHGWSSTSSSSRALRSPSRQRRSSSSRPSDSSEGWLMAVPRERTQRGFRTARASRA